MNRDDGTDEQAGREIGDALKLWVVLARAHDAVAEHVRRDIEGHGLGVSEFGVLEALYHKGPLRLGEVGEKVLLTSGSITYVVDKLERKGLLGRQPCTEDRRVCYAELTEAGRSLMRRVFPAHARAIREAVAGLTGEEQRRVSALLKRLGTSAAERLR